LKFLKNSQAKGYRFSGAGFVDPEQRLVKNRYFIIGNDGNLHSWVRTMARTIRFGKLET
jgi:hypothetical protein